MFLMNNIEVSKREKLLNHELKRYFANIDVASLIKISKYYITARYPDMLPDNLEESLPGKAETEEAIALARIVIDKARCLVKTAFNDCKKEKDGSS